MVGGSFLAVGQSFGEGFLVDGVGHGLAHLQVGQNAGGIKYQVAGLGVALRHRAGNIGEGSSLLVVVPGQKCTAVDQVDLPVLECLKPGRGIWDVLDNDFIIVGLLSPVVFVADKADIVAVHDLLIHIGAGTHHAIHRLVVPFLQYSRRYQDHNLRIAEIHQIGKVGIGIVESHRVLVHNLNALHIGNGGDVTEIGIGVRKFKVCLDRLRIERRSIVESDSLLQMESQGLSAIGKLPALRQAGDDLPIFIVNKALIAQLCADIVLHIHVEGVEGV